MNILMVLDRTFPPDIRVEHEVLSLIDAGHEVHIACFTFDNEPAEEEWKGAKIHRKQISDLTHKTSVGCLKFPFYFNFWRSFIDHIFQNHQFDAIHIHDLPLATVGVEVKNKHDIRMTLDLHENWPGLLNVSPHVKGLMGRLLSSDKQWREYEKKMVNAADDVIVVVEESKARIRSFTEDPDKIHVVSNTPILSELSSLRSEKTEKSQKLRLFYGGGISKHRGLQLVIQSFQNVKDKDIELLIVGDGSYLQHLKRLTNSLELEEMVTFFGWKPLNELTELMLQADVLLIPHQKSEHSDSTIPHKLFQYMLTGKPILTTNCIPIQRIIHETDSGFVYKFDDPEDFVDKLNYIYTKWEQGDTLKMNGVDSVLNIYNWSKDEQVLINIYNESS